MKTSKFLVTAFLLIQSCAVVQAQPADGFTHVTDAMLNEPDAADWLTWRRTTNAWGYSPLDQVNRRNVGQLQLVWTRGLQPGVQEGTPLVYDGTMYFPNPNDITQALDAASGDLIWEHRRELPEDLADYFPVVVTNRNLAIYGRLLFDNGADNYLYAIDAESGERAWETRIQDYKKGGLHSSGPIVAGGKVVSGRGCQPASGPDACIITAHDAVTGEELWRTRTMPRPGEPGDESWGGIPYEQRWHVGTWMVPSYDAELNLIYVGTSVTAPAPKYMLAGNNYEYLYHNSTLALDADTGEIVWYYQHLVDHWDLDHPFERILLDTAVAPDPDEVTWINPNLEPGEQRRVITGIPGKTGIVYTLDRETGEFLWARPTVQQTVVSAIDGGTGSVLVNREMVFTEAGQERQVCPSALGGKNWPAGAYSPLTDTMYFPLLNTCMAITAVYEERPGLDSLYSIATRNRLPEGEDNLGSIYAISAETGATAWQYDQRAATTSLLTTGGGLLFGGDTNGRFRAFDQRDGSVLWEVNLGAPVSGFPITYSVDGRQYVAVSTGMSVNAMGSAQLTPELSPGTANNLFVFALQQ